MTIKRVKQAAATRGIYFDGKKRFLNNVVGIGYEVYIGYRFIQADTLEGLYKMIMTIPKITKS